MEELYANTSYPMQHSVEDCHYSSWKLGIWTSFEQAFLRVVCLLLIPAGHIYIVVPLQNDVQDCYRLISMDTTSFLPFYYSEIQRNIEALI